MKNITLFSLIALVAVAPVAYGASYVELQSQFNVDSSPVQQVTYSDWHHLTAGLGFFTLTLVNESWGEVYGGVAYTFAPWIEAGIGLGVETDVDPARYGSYLAVTRPKTSLLVLHEYGGSGHWVRAIGAYNVSSAGFGFMHETNLGTGPYWEARLPKSKVWTSVLFGEHDAPVQVIALQYVF